jgi:fructose-specific phosphotransferase system component IIB
MTKYAVTEAAEKRKATVGVETNGGFNTHFTPEPLG